MSTQGNWHVRWLARGPCLYFRCKCSNTVSELTVPILGVEIVQSPCLPFCRLELWSAAARCASNSALLCHFLLTLSTLTVVVAVWYLSSSHNAGTSTPFSQTFVVRNYHSYRWGNSWFIHNSESADKCMWYCKFLWQWHQSYSTTKKPSADNAMIRYRGWWLCCLCMFVRVWQQFTSTLL